MWWMIEYPFLICIDLFELILSIEEKSRRGKDDYGEGNHGSGIFRGRGMRYRGLRYGSLRGRDRYRDKSEVMMIS